MDNSISTNIEADATQQPFAQQSDEEFHASKSALISSAHFINDLYTGFMSPLLPSLIAQFALLKVQASFFLFLYQGASILQPLIGNWADRVNLRKVALFAPAVTGIFMCLLGTTPNYYAALLFCLLAGISSASMHSILPPMVSSYAGKNIGKGMSFWMVGGELGVMVGPMIITAILATSNIKYAPWLMIGGIAISLLLSIQLKNEPFEATVTKENGRIPGKDLVAVMLPLGGIMFMRSLMQTTAETYLPVYMLETGSSVWLAGASISILEGFGVLGVIIGGYASDHYGFKPSLLVSIIVSGLATLAFAFADGTLRIACLAVLGTATMMTLPIGMAITQEYFPKNRSLANGIYFAILFAVSALMSVTGGFLYDQIGGKMAFAVGGLVAFLAIPFIFMLPKNKKAPTMEPGDN